MVGLGFELRVWLPSKLLQGPMRGSLEETPFCGLWTKCSKGFEANGLGFTAPLLLVDRVNQEMVGERATVRIVMWLWEGRSRRLYLLFTCLSFSLKKFLVRKFQTYAKADRIKPTQNRILVPCPRFNSYQLIANSVSLHPNLLAHSSTL